MLRMKTVIFCVITDHGDQMKSNCCDLCLDPLMQVLFTVLILMEVFPLSVLILEDLSR